MAKISNSKLIVILIACFLFPSAACAARLYLEPAEGEYHQGDTFIVNARIDIEQDCVNTVKADIGFSTDLMEAVDFSYGNSILTIVPEAPEIKEDAGIISFSGGMPGGFCGALPGDPGKSNLLGKIIFKVNAGSTGNAEVKFLNTSQVLLNDGLGTRADLATEGAVFTVLAGAVEAPQTEWQTELEKDTIPPEPFDIKINRDPAVFDGKYFITFNTTDKQTGVDHYEAKDGRGDWRRVQSPYVLEDQSLEGIIKVKAVDKAGNERIAQYGTEIRTFLMWILIGLAATTLAWFSIRKYGKKPRSKI